MKDIPLKEIMVVPAVTANQEDPLSKVEEKFRRRGIRHVPVIDEQNRVVGMFTRNDLARCLAPHKTEDGFTYDKEAMDEFTLKYVMAPDPTTLGPDDLLSRAVEIMTRNKYGCIPIVKEGNVLVGIVTQVDIMTRNKYGCIPIVKEGNVLVGIVTQVDIMKLLLRELKR